MKPKSLVVLLVLHTLISVFGNVVFAKVAPKDSVIPLDHFVFVLDSQVAHLEDSTNALVIKNILKPEQQDLFEINKGNIPFNLGFSNNFHWFAFQFENTGKKDMELVVEIDNPLLDSVLFYSTIKDTIATAKQAGRKVALVDWDIKFRNPAFTLTIPPHKYRQVYLRVSSTQMIRVPVKVYDRSSFDMYKDRTNLAFSLFYAIVFIIILHNLFLFLSSRDFTYLFYILANAVLVIILINLNGFPFQYGELSFLRIDHFTIPYLLMTYFFLLFSVGYLHVRKLPRPILYMFAFASVAYPIAGLVVYYLHIPFTKAQQPMLAVLLVIMFIGAFVAMQKRYRPAWHYLSSVWIILLGTAIYFLAFKGSVRNSFWMEYALQAGLVIGATLFSMGLSERQKIIEKEKMVGHGRETFISGFVEFLKEIHTNEAEMDDTDNRFP